MPAVQPIRCRNPSITADPHRARRRLASPVVDRVHQLFACLPVASIVTIFSARLCNLPASTRAEIESVVTQVVKVQLNGELREVPEGLTLAALLEWLDLPRDRVAVERNLEIVPRTGWDVTQIQPGDRLEVVHLVGGGLE